MNGPADPRHPLFESLERRKPGLYAGASRQHALDVGPEALRRSLAPLLETRPDLICGGHGMPVRHATPLLERLLELDWQAALDAGGDAGVSPAP